VFTHLDNIELDLEFDFKPLLPTDNEDEEEFEPDETLAAIFAKDLMLNS